MKTKKYLILTIIVVLFISIIAMVVVKYNINYLNRLSASVSQVNEDGTLWIECDNNTLTSTDIASCTIKAQLEKNALTFQGRLEYSSNLQVSEITRSSIFSDGYNNNVDMTYVGDGANGTISIATFKVTGLSNGSGYVKLTDIGSTDEEEYRLYIGLQDDSGIKYSYFDDVTYDFVVDSYTPELSSDTTLKSLKVGVEEVLSSLETIVPNEVSTVSITATPTHENATVTSGTGNKTLNVGENNVSITVLAEDRISTRTYNLTIIREAANQQSSINTLSELRVLNGTIPIEFTTEFSSNVGDYISSVPNSVSSIEIQATTTDQNATITSGSLGVKSLRVGENVFEIIVKAENQEERTYTITITRENKIDNSKSSDNDLKTLNVTNTNIIPEFSSDVTEYTAIVSYNISKVRLEAATNDENATIKEEDLGEKDLEEGANVFSITVTAEDNSIKIYTIMITREKENATVTCDLLLTSSVYNVDESAGVISIPIDDNGNTIISNVKTTADISVSDDKVILRCQDQTKEYKINRYWNASTGQNAIRYTVIITGLLVIIGVLLVLKNKSKK